jgi:hypothetical protein
MQTQVQGEKWSELAPPGKKRKEEEPTPSTFFKGGHCRLPYCYPSRYITAKSHLTGIIAGAYVRDGTQVPEAGVFGGGCALKETFGKALPISMLPFVI